MQAKNCAVRALKNWELFSLCRVSLTAPFLAIGKRVPCNTFWNHFCAVAGLDGGNVATISHPVPCLVELFGESTSMPIRMQREEAATANVMGSLKCWCKWPACSVNLKSVGHIRMTRDVESWIKQVSYLPSIVPLTHIKSNMERCCTSSQSPTPPAWGQTGIWCCEREGWASTWVESLVMTGESHTLAAIRMMAKTSFTPPTRQASIWQMPIALDVINCLKSMRFAQCSPVATRIPRGAMARAMARCPRTSSDKKKIN